MGDQLFDPETGEPKASPSSPNSPTPSGSMTPEQVKGMVDESLSEFTSRLTQDLNQFGNQLVEAVGAKAAPSQPQTGEDDLASELLANPGKIIDERVGAKVDEVIREKLAPHLLTQAEDKFQTLLQQHQKQIDNEYGEGAFDKHLREEVESIFNKLPPESKSSVAHVQTVIEQQIGKRAGELRPLANEVARKAKEVAEAPVMLHGGLPGRPQAGRISEEDREFAQAYAKATGEEIDLKRLAEIRDMRGPDQGWTLADWKKSQQKEAS